MKWVTFTQAGKTRLGAVLGEVVVDMAAAYGAFKPGASADLLSDMLAFLQGGEAAQQAAGEVLEWAASGDEVEGQSFAYALADVKIGPPVPNPGKIVCLGRNYADHSHEQNLEPPKSPILFVKFSSSVIGPGESITWPADASQKVDYEAELAVVIGRTARNVPAEEAFDYVAGYTIADDVTARDVQKADGQWIRGKSFDTFCPMGPYLVTPDEVGDPEQLSIRCRVNGDLRQDSNTGHLVFGISELIAFITKTASLLPGDVILTGTPGGVGVHMDPPVFLKPGDEVEVEIEKLGVLRNPVS